MLVNSVTLKLHVKQYAVSVEMHAILQTLYTVCVNPVMQTKCRLGIEF